MDTVPVVLEGGAIALDPATGHVCHHGHAGRGQHDQERDARVNAQHQDEGAERQGELAQGLREVHDEVPQGAVDIVTEAAQCLARGAGHGPRAGALQDGRETRVRLLVEVKDPASRAAVVVPALDRVPWRRPR